MRKIALKIISLIKKHKYKSAILITMSLVYVIFILLFDTFNPLALDMKSQAMLVGIEIVSNFAVFVVIAIDDWVKFLEDLQY